MLILSRKNGQKIIINDNIEITILESKNDNCKIAIEAPKDVKVYREEVYKQIKSSNQMSTDSLTDLSQLADLMPKTNDEPKKKTVIIKKKPE
ncbi:carbon storage regulator CsrA [bacterium]|nr:carbon storage regulator CsrA [bacterium]